MYIANITASNPAISDGKILSSPSDRAYITLHIISINTAIQMTLISDGISMVIVCLFVCLFLLGWLIITGRYTQRLSACLHLVVRGRFQKFLQLPFVVEE